MKFTLSWLKEHLHTDEPLAALADKLTMIGLEVENIDDKAKAACAYAWSTPATAIRSRWYAARRTPAPA
jgi:hypothetical protein